VFDIIDARCNYEETSLRLLQKINSIILKHYETFFLTFPFVSF